jgi:hypothetical protein
MYHGFLLAPSSIKPARHLLLTTCRSHELGGSFFLASVIG